MRYWIPLNLITCKSFVSNQLDELLINSLLQQGAPIDAFGIGTRLLTAYNCPALQGVYKQSIIGYQPTLKFAESYARTTLPGRKKVIRYYDPMGHFDSDGVMMESEDEIEIFYDPLHTEQQHNVGGLVAKPIMQLVMEDGHMTGPLPSPTDSARYASQQFSYLPGECKRFENPQHFKIGISPFTYETADIFV